MIDWRQILAENDRWLRAVVFSRVRQRNAVDDIMQEVALAAINAKSPPPVEKTAPWLYRVTIRQTLLFRRACGRRRKLQSAAAAETIDQTVTSDPLHWLLATEKNEQIRIALNCLPPRDTEVLLLKYIDNYSYRQIAARLGVSESAIESRLHRARAKLRSELYARNVIEATP